MRTRERAERAGRAAGKAAASWYFDGNTTEATYAAVARGIADCDPQIMDGLPCLDLSGQWADGLTDADVLGDCGYAGADGMLERTPEHASQIIDWYRDAYDMEVIAVIEREASLAVGP